MSLHSGKALILPRTPSEGTPVVDQLIVIITQVLLATQLSWIDITIGYN